MERKKRKRKKKEDQRRDKRPHPPGGCVKMQINKLTTFKL